MKKIYLFIITAFSSILPVEAQVPTFADDVAPIIFDKCSKCHHNGGVAPFELLTYTQVSSNGTWIQSAVNAGEMPPWPPDNNYNQYVHNRSLSAAQIQTINDWVNGGMPQGNPANTPPTPVFATGPQLGPADISVRIPDYISKATTSNDDYVCISLPSGLTANRIIKKIEIIPGNPAIVHHCLAYIDENGNYQTDTTSHSCAGPVGQSIPLIAGYAPGGSPTTFPDDNLLRLGVEMQAGSNIVLAMHYPEGSQGQLDSTRINIHFYPQGATGVRQVSADPVLYDYAFTINANTIDSVDAYFPNASTGLPTPMTLYSIFPHTHLLGKSFIIYAVNNSPPFDRIPLMHIPKWDFEWQDFYVFKYLQKIPAGYKLYGKAVYDNTTNNPYNPNNPPQNVSFGLNTADEMFIVYFQYLTYQNGDENINVDSLIQLQTLTNNNILPIATNENGLFLSTYPNPSNQTTTLHYFVDREEEVTLNIYNVTGQLVESLVQTTQKGEQIIQWDGTNTSGNIVPAGIYFSQLQVGNRTVTKQIIRSLP